MQSVIPPLNFEDLLVQGNRIIPSGTVVSRQVTVDAGLFDEGLRGAEDYDVCLHIAYRGAKIAYQSKVLALRRIHGRSMSTDNTRMLEGVECVLTKLDKTLNLSTETRSLLLNRLASIRAYLYLQKGKQHLFSGNIDQARDYFVSANISLRQANPRLTSPLPDSATQALRRTAKLRVLLWGLRTVPRMTTFGARMWENSLLALQVLKTRSNI